MRYNNGQLTAAINEAFADAQPGLASQHDQFPSMTLTTFITMTDATVEGQVITTHIG